MPSEFDRQLENLVRKGYPVLVGVPEEEFRQRLEPLRERLGELVAEGLGGPVPQRLGDPTVPNGEGEAAHLPFVIVVSSNVMPGDRAMPLVELDGRSGFTTMAAD